MSTPQQAVHALQLAVDVPSIRAALLTAVQYDTRANPDVQVEIRAARRRLRRLQRIALLTPAHDPTPLPPQREASHRERMTLLLEVRLKRSLGVPTVAITERAIKDACRDSRCTDCSLSPAFRAVCLNYLLECIGVRVATRVRYDAANGYAIDPALSAFLQLVAADPLSAWLDHSEAFYALPASLDRQYNNVVLRTLDGAQQRRKEAREYELHKDSLRRMIEAFGRCERAYARDA